MSDALPGLLKVLSANRDRCARLLAGLIQSDEELQQHRKSLEQQRREQLAELGQLASRVDFDPRQVVARREYLSQLDEQIVVFNLQRAGYAQKIERLRQELMEIDQGMKTAERLLADLRTQSDLKQRLREQHDLDDFRSS